MSRRNLAMLRGAAYNAVLALALSFTLPHPGASAPLEPERQRFEMLERLCTELAMPFVEDRFADEAAPEFSVFILKACSKGLATNFPFQLWISEPVKELLASFSQPVEAQTGRKTPVDAPAASGTFFGPFARNLFQVGFYATLQDD